MDYFVGRFGVSGCCFRGRNSRCYLALCFGLLTVVVLVFLCQDGDDIKCPVRFTVRRGYFNNRSIQLMRQIAHTLYGGVSSEIPYYCEYEKPKSFRKSTEDDFQPVEVNSSYVYSAYLDDRLAPDVDPEALPVVRIVTALPRDATSRARRNWLCLFWYDEIDLPLVMPLAAITDLNIMDTSTRIMSVLVLCNLPNTSTSVAPVAVSLVNDICQGPQNHLPIIDLRKLRRKSERMSSNAKNTNSPSHRRKVSKFTVCIPPLFGNYMTAMEVMEFIELNRLLGADKFVFYQESGSNEMVSCLRLYSKVGLVEIYNWTLPFKLADISYHGQILAQNECLFRVMYRTKYLINQDLDEFIIPMRTTNWKKMLKLIHENEYIVEEDRAASYSFRNLFFPLSLSNYSTLDYSFTVGNYTLKTMTKTICLDYVHPWKERSKVMGRPERLLMWHVHEILDSSLVRNEDENLMVDEGDGLLFHYRHLGPEYSSDVTNRRMWRYQRRLVNSITKASSSICRT